ncbi:MAG: hypothetical protein Q8M40_00570 [Legionella sp.]|nr:hypothetical protein [Legionella sp.]
MIHFKKLSTVLACTAALYAGSSLAANHDLSTNLSAGYDLPTNELQTFNASVFHTTHLNCKVRTAGGQANDVTVLALKKRVIVNGTILSEGVNATLVLRAGDNVTFELDARGKLGLTNNSDSLVNLYCR